MTSELLAVPIPKLDGVRIELLPPRTVKLGGTLARRDLSRDLGGFFRALHDDAITRGFADICVDVRDLTFVNSSSIRLFIDWAAWVRGVRSARSAAAAAGAGKPYLLRFLVTNQHTWQVTTFAALSSLMGDAIAVEPS